MMTGERAIRKESSMAKKKLRPTVSHLATSKFSKDLEMLEVTAPQPFRTYDAKVR
jgi:hypothetical protein